jgi:KDO2-lipid IV(A) lauroyltransferase
MNRALLTLLVGFWKLILFLPRPMHKVFILILGNLLYIIPLKRNKISGKNIDLCFPGMSKRERKNLHKANVIASAQIIFDSGIAWFWSDEKIKKNISYEIKGIESLVNEQKDNNGVLLFFKHSLHLELDARLLGMNIEVYGVERVHNSDLFDAVQKKGRLKSVKDTCDKNNPIKFIRWLKKGKTVLYATDQDYGLNQSDVINFFAQPAATISAPSKIINTTGCKTYFMNTYIDSGKYIIDIEELNLNHLNGSNFSQRLNDFIEKKIRNNPDEYLWQHRRFKSTLGKEDFYA